MVHLARQSNLFGEPGGAVEARILLVAAEAQAGSVRVVARALALFLSENGHGRVAGLACDRLDERVIVLVGL
eukprot:jgi/Chrpa1/25258/Chrysochromulina_OHIO_Genome00001355-RA